MREYVLEEVTYAAVKERRYEVAVLPWGATEAHNLHLPYGQDTKTAYEIAIRAAAKAHDRGAKIVVLPPIPFGVQTNTMGFPLNINMHPSTQLAVLRDVVESVERHGVPKLVLLNGHGGNELTHMVRELHLSTNVFMCVVDWWKIAPELHDETFEGGGDHANEMETSVALALHPHLVLPLDVADEGGTKQSKLAGIREGFVWAPRPWHIVTTNSGVGNPKKATRDKGDRYLAAVLDHLTRFFAELSDAKVNETFPY